MHSADLIVAARRTAGLSQDELAARIGRPQSTVARWETGHQLPPFERVIEALHACGLEPTVGLARYDDSYDAQIARQLRLEPCERVEQLARGEEVDGFEPLQVIRGLAPLARFVVVGDVAAALQGWPITLDRRILHIVPADSSVGRVEQFARRLQAEAVDDRLPGSQRWLLPDGVHMRSTPFPAGTRGFGDLARDASRVAISADTSIRVASLLDLIRIAEASPESDARIFVPALWATLERSQRQDLEAAGR